MSTPCRWSARCRSPGAIQIRPGSTTSPPAASRAGNGVRSVRRSASRRGEALGHVLHRHPGEHHHRELRPPAPDLLERLEAVHAWQVDVQAHHIGRQLPDPLQRHLAIGSGAEDGESLHLRERLAHQPPDDDGIVHDEHPDVSGHGVSGSWPSSARSCARRAAAVIDWRSRSVELWVRASSARTRSRSPWASARASSRSSAAAWEASS